MCAEQFDQKHQYFWGKAISPSASSGSKMTTERWPCPLVRAALEAPKHNELEIWEALQRPSK
jgi:hypothetical protein